MKVTISVLLLILSSSIFVNTIEPDHSKVINGILNQFMDSSPKELFKVWHLVFDRQYTFDSEQAKLKFKNFKENLKIIKETNAKNLGYSLGLNQFSDITNAEFKNMMCRRIPSGQIGKNIDQFNKDSNFLTEDDDDDLTKRNLEILSPIDHSKWFGVPRNQGQCGSCWAFAAAGAIEGNNSLKLRKVVPYVSTQQLVDCDKGNSGCDSGKSFKAYDYTKKNGIMNDSDYTYKAKRGTCAYSALKPLTHVSGYQYCSNYTDLKCTVDKVSALLQKGPLSVGIDGGTNEFQSYKSGIFSAKCSNDNHTVILVGYGVEASKQYWLVRNSWGTTWGMNGYIKVAVNPSNSNSCYVDNEGVLPLIN